MPTQTTTCRCRSCRAATESPIESLEGTPYCNDCYHTRYILCDDCGCELRRDVDTIREHQREYYCESCYESRVRTCEDCGCELTPGEVVEGPGNTPFCQSCYDNAITRCSDCDCQVWIDEANRQGDSYLCRNCASRGEWADAGFYTESPTYTELRSERKFGIEYETHTCDDHNTIRGDTVFGCKPDGSVDGMEFVSPVLYGDEGLEEVRKLCGHARRLGWSVNSACGFHLHCDLSSESNENCFKVAHAYMHTYEFWTRFISNARMRNYYCAKHFYSESDLIGYTDFYEWCCDIIQGERYNWVNWYAYTRHKTVEIRHHSATLNPTKSVNWIKAHTRFIDAVVQRSKAEVVRALAGRSVFEQFEAISSWWDDDDLTSFYRNRAEQFHKPFRRAESALVTA